MRIRVAETRPGVHAALVDHGGKAVPCCAGHPDPYEAATHAWKLTRALQRLEARSRAGVPG